jgi:hypothetical protein
MPRPLGIHINFFIALLGLALTAAGYWLASRGELRPATTR